MLAKGFGATSVDDVCQKAGVTKGCFFHYFDSKDALGQALIEKWSGTREEVHQALFGNDKDPLKRVYHYIESYAQMARQGALGKGCLLGTFSSELADVAPIRKACADGFAAWTDHLARELAKAKALHAPKAKLDCRAVAEHFVATVEGAILLAKAGQNDKVIARCVVQFKDYLAAVLGRQEK